MTHSIANKNIVVVAVKNHRDDIRFAEKVQSFCKNDKTDLYFVHVLEGRMAIPTFYADMFGSFDICELGDESFDKARREAWAQLRSMKTTLGDPANLRLQILDNQNAAEAILDESALVQASMIAIEVQEHLYKAIPQGLSVALSLLQKSSVPVLVLKKLESNRFEQKHRVIMIADDLSQDCAPAVHKAMQLAARWGHTRVIHMHVIEEKLHGMLQSLRKIGQKMDLASADTVESADFFRSNVDIMLRRRSWELQNALQNAECTYETVVKIGSVTDEIAQIVQKNQPTLSVFGRTQGFHPMGRVSFGSMLSECEAVLVVP